MNFQEAIQAMKEGKKVKRKDSDNVFINAYNGIMWFSKNAPKELYHGLFMTEIEATDWEIYENEDNWNIVDNLRHAFNPNTELASKYELSLLKEKILQDEEKILDSFFNNIISDEKLLPFMKGKMLKLKVDLEKIKTKRFGF